MKKVNRLAADLSSFANVDIKFASEGLTKALFGETEQAKSLGIVIRQDTKAFKESVKAKMVEKNVSMQQAKAMVILEEATRQSKNAIGDYQRSSTSFANQQKKINSTLSETRVEIGSRLIPALKLLQQDVIETSDANQGLGTSIGNAASKTILAVRWMMLWFKKLSLKWRETQLKIVASAFNAAAKMAKFFGQGKLAEKMTEGWAKTTLAAGSYGDAVTELNKKIGETNAVWDSLDMEQAMRNTNQKKRNKAEIDAHIEKEKKKVKASKKANKEIEKSATEHSMTILSTIGSQVSQLGSILSMDVENRKTIVDQEQQAEMDKIAQKYDSEKELIDNKLLTEKEKADELKILDEKRAREEKALEEKKAKEKRKLEYEGAKNKKNIAIAETLISIPQAAFDSYKALAGIPFVGPALGITAAASATALGFAKLAMIQQQPLPKLAKGGLVTQSAGGTDVTVGEGGNDEAVLPLNDSVFDRMALGLMGAIGRMQTGGTVSTAGTGSSFGITINMGNKVFFKEIETAIENREIVIDVADLGE